MLFRVVAIILAGCLDSSDRMCVPSFCSILPQSPGVGRFAFADRRSALGNLKKDDVVWVTRRGADVKLRRVTVARATPGSSRNSLASELVQRGSAPFAVAALRFLCRTVPARLAAAMRTGPSRTRQLSSTHTQRSSTVYPSSQSSRASRIAPSAACRARFTLASVTQPGRCNTARCLRHQDDIWGCRPAGSTSVPECRVFAKLIRPRLRLGCSGMTSA